jgi:hypothetical protein
METLLHNNPELPNAQINTPGKRYSPQAPRVQASESKESS